MPLTQQHGKDRVIFATKEEHSEPSTVTLPPEEQPPGLILPDGSINWNCPCLGGMATGPCGVEFREAFSCFHYSEAEPKGSDCYDAFKTMQDCMAQYPGLYRKDEDENNLEDLDDVGNQPPDLKPSSIAADPNPTPSTSAAEASNKS